MARAILVVMDSFGIGGAPDAASFGDEGSNTLGHILMQSLDGKADKDGLRNGPLTLPNLAHMGLFHAMDLAGDDTDAKPYMPEKTEGFWGAASEISHGKDTPSGHWEIAGYPVDFDWGYFPHEMPAFPADLLAAIYKDAGIDGSIANCHASGTEVIAEFGDEHVETGKPIFYTSADSVLQIAAHEEHFGLQRLYELCLTAKRYTDPLNIGRVIARPFLGDGPDTYARTGNRRDFAIPPHKETLLDRVTNAGKKVIAVGKIGDIFAHKGVSEVRKAHGNAAIGDATLTAIDDAGDGDLVFSNFVDFDMLYGHRRDVPGYAAALEAFDAFLPSMLDRLRDGDLLLITADHGCDPTWTGTDHTRERVPVIGMLKGGKDGSIGVRQTFSDISQTISEHLGIDRGPSGTSFYPLIGSAIA